MFNINMPEFLQIEYFNNTIVDYLIFFSIVGLGFILAKVIYWVIQNIIKKFTEKTVTRLDDILVEVLETPIVVYIVLLATEIGWNFLSFADHPKIDLYFGHFAYMIFVLNTAWLISRLINAILDNYIKPFAEKTETDLDDHLLPILSKVVNIITFLIGIIMILHHFGQEIGPMLAGLGIGGLAFALAAKDLLSNLFGSITIILDKPFKVGQRIKINSYDGFVKEINLRTTKIQTLEGTMIYVPNSNFTDRTLENVTEEWARRVKMDIGLVYDTDVKKMKKAKEIINKILNEQEGIDKEKKMVYFTDFGAYSKNILLIYWITDSNNIFPIRDNVNFRIMDEFAKAKIEMAFPTQTIEIKK
jgi:MscS family membrane protein